MAATGRRVLLDTHRLSAQVRLCLPALRYECALCVRVYARAHVCACVCARACMRVLACVCARAGARARRARASMSVLCVRYVRMVCLCGYMPARACVQACVHVRARARCRDSAGQSFRLPLPVLPSGPRD